MLTNKFVILILVFGFSRVFFYAFSDKPWQSPDEVTHFEAAYWRARIPLNPIPYPLKTEFQEKIIRSLFANDFFRYIHVPTPQISPKTFDQTPFLEEAPSKINRPFLYYFLIGQFTHLFPENLIYQLLTLRFLNGILIIISFFLLIKSLSIIFPGNRLTFTFGSLFFLSNPALWQVCSSVTMESWKLLLNSTALFLFSTQYRGKKREYVNIGFAVYVLLSLFTHWTQLMVALLISIAAYWRRIPKLVFLHMILLAIFVGLITILSFSNNQNSLFVHEIENTITSITNLLDNPEVLTRLDLKRLYCTFWSGFCWLTFPCNSLSMVLFVFPSLFICWGCLKGLLKNPHQFNFFRSISLISIFVVAATLLRGLSLEPSIQGRYLYPIWSLLTTLAAFSIHHSKTSQLRKSIILSFITLIAIGDGFTTINTWFRHLHIENQNYSRPVEILSQINLTEKSQNAAIIKFGTDAAEKFEYDGFYPKESDKKAWFRRYATVFLPLLSNAYQRFNVSIFPYPHDSNHCMFCKIYINGRMVYRNPLMEGWNEIDFIASPHGLNPLSPTVLTIEYPFEVSPYEVGKSRDRRHLSAAIRRIYVQTLGYEINNPNHSYWSADEEGIKLYLAPDHSIYVKASKKFEFRDSRNFKYILTPSQALLNHASPLVITKFNYSNIWSHEWNRFLKAFQSASKNLPGIFQYPTTHLSFMVLYLVIWAVICLVVFTYN